MTVELSPRRRAKLLAYLDSEKWLSRSSCTIRCLAQLHGLLVNAAEFCPWAKCQFFLIQRMLRTAISAQYHKYHNYRKRRNIPDRIRASLPRELERRVASLIARDVAEFIWRNHLQIPVSPETRATLRIIYDYLQAGKPWCMLIGHIVPRDPAIYAATDASQQGIGVVIPALRVFCCLPFTDSLVALLHVRCGTTRQLNINITEFIGGLLAYIIATILVNTAPSEFPPAPILHLDMDNTSAVAWCQTMSSSSLWGQTLLRLLAEFRLVSPVGLAPQHLKGTLNCLPDTISRPCELYQPRLKRPSDKPYHSHISQICRKLPELASWRVFQPTPALLSALRCALSSSAKWERPSLPKTWGQFVTAESILCGSSSSSSSSTTFSL